jgi:hypothetical protein
LAVWPGVKQILKITRTREFVKKGKKTVTVEVSYGITSLSAQKVTPKKIMELWRNHWNIENKLHWVRDILGPPKNADFNCCKSLKPKSLNPQFFGVWVYGF